MYIVLMINIDIYIVGDSDGERESRNVPMGKCMHACIYA